MIPLQSPRSSGPLGLRRRKIRFVAVTASLVVRVEAADGSRQPELVFAGDEGQRGVAVFPARSAAVAFEVHRFLAVFEAHGLDIGMGGGVAERQVEKVVAVIENPVRRTGRPFLLDDEGERGVVPRGIQVSGQRVGRGAQRVIPSVAAVGEQAGAGLIAAVLFGMCAGEEFEGGRVGRVLDIPPAPVAVPVFQHVGDIDRADIGRLPIPRIDRSFEHEISLPQLPVQVNSCVERLITRIVMAPIAHLLERIALVLPPHSGRAGAVRFGRYRHIML